ncbi:MAG: hypothetical protein PHE68_01925 [Candidatus Peribacteraceae bacterium]|nr:hypothetical protein [Candidatus Peribacteraceae bacterium]MDD5075173.1 hypothetical protein [Candidatus Peribacteraceae bacterium]
MKKLAIVTLCFLALTACGKKGVDIGEKNGTGSTATYRYNMPSGGEIVDTRYGKETFFAYGAVAGRAETPANGLAKTHRFETGQSLHTLQVNIALPRNGMFYEGWVENPKTGEKLSTGHLQSIQGDARHNLSFETEKDLSAFTKVTITLEDDDGNSAQGTVVAEGTLKELKRDK